EGADLLQPLADVLPVDDLPEGLHPFSLDVLVLQVIGMLPHVEYENRHSAVPDVALVVVDLLGHESFSDRLPRKRAPARALDVECSLTELVLEIGYGTEPFFGSLGQLSFRLAPAVRAHIAPEKRGQRGS